MVIRPAIQWQNLGIQGLVHILGYMSNINALDLSSCNLSMSNNSSNGYLVNNMTECPQLENLSALVITPTMAINLINPKCLKSLKFLMRISANEVTESSCLLGLFSETCRIWRACWDCRDALLERIPKLKYRSYPEDGCRVLKRQPASVSSATANPNSENVIWRIVTEYSESWHFCTSLPPISSPNFLYSQLF